MTYQKALEILYFGIKKDREEAYAKLIELIEYYESINKQLDLISLRSENIDKYGTLDYFAFKLGVTPRYITGVLSGQSTLSKNLSDRINLLLRAAKPSKSFIKQDLALIRKVNELTTELLKGDT